MGKGTGNAPRRKYECEKSTGEVETEVFGSASRTNVSDNDSGLLEAAANRFARLFPNYPPLRVISQPSGSQERCGLSTDADRAPHQQPHR